MEEIYKLEFVTYFNVAIHIRLSYSCSDLKAKWLK
jgi:hypothetical protein